ncbi:aberrant large forked product, putative [Ricinus communis]|uniref:Aberrant large forked product, putative n=1 Tax=Ricinus communis TaxID=3988 RepID=B9RUE4_RICCO|nr:aberrant large forked product, putative [Ricinus communis]|eukprot:XP_002517389.1 ankyrin repeat domain-containing protein EMB506, chloroplastic [Ricinus communis]
MVTWVTTASPFNLPLPRFAATPGTSTGTNLFKASTGSFDFLLANKCRKLTTCRVESKWAYPSERLPGVWEDPDDGSGSDYDEVEELEENDMDYESDWEEETYAKSTTRIVDYSTSNNYEEDSEEATYVASTSTTTVRNSTSKNYEEDLSKEIIQLLQPEERAILQQNATYNLDKLSTAKWKPLQTLALSGQIRFMDKLLADGLDIDSVDKDGLTALHKAIVGKKEAVISHLLRKGANPHVKDRDGASSLHYAVQIGALQTVKLLIKYNVDINVADNEGWTPLHVAVQTRKRDIVKVLLVNGADKNRKNKDGMTPVDLCLCYGKDFKSYDLAKLVKVVPANRDF